MGIVVNKRTMTSREWAVDAAIAVGIFLLGCLQVVLGGGSSLAVDEGLRELVGTTQLLDYGNLPFFLLAAMSLALVVRRVVTWPVFVVVFGVYLLGSLQMEGHTLMVLAPAVALFTVAEERSRWEVLAAAIVAVAVTLLMPLSAEDISADLYARILTLTYFGIALFAGVSVQSYRRYQEEAEQRLAESELAREVEAQRRVEEERVRIAREIHDITAHSLSAVSIQAAAAERIVDKDPQLAKEALRTIRDTSKGSLDEIRAMIGVLRGEDEPAESVPTHGTDHLDELVQYLENAGVEAVCDTSDYHRENVPLYLDVGVYGIAREAATNIVKHARARHAAITLSGSSDYVTLTVQDDGRGMRASRTSTEEPDMPRKAGGGHGLQGMAERAHLLGGSFEAYDMETGGFAVVVRIPYRGKDYRGA